MKPAVARITARSVRGLLHRLNATEQHQHALMHVLDQFDTGIILIDAALRPIFANKRAREIAAAKDGLVLNQDGLAAGGPLETKVLRRALAAAIRSTAQRRAAIVTTAGATSRLSLSRPSRRPPLMVNVMPIPADPAGGRAMATSLAAVFVFEAEAPAVIDAELLIATFGLAPREGELAVHLAGGAKLSDVALALGIGIGTARWYLKRVLEKTGTHRQAELTNLIRLGFGARGT